MQQRWDVRRCSKLAISYRLLQFIFIHRERAGSHLFHSGHLSSLVTRTLQRPSLAKTELMMWKLSVCPRRSWTDMTRIVRVTRTRTVRCVSRRITRRLFCENAEVSTLSTVALKPGTGKWDRILSRRCQPRIDMASPCAEPSLYLSTRHKRRLLFSL